MDLRCGDCRGPARPVPVDRGAKQDGGQSRMREIATSIHRRFVGAPLIDFVIDNLD